jgi:predicted PurR-regulated permease PerM
MLNGWTTFKALYPNLGSREHLCENLILRVRLTGQSTFWYIMQDNLIHAKVPILRMLQYVVYGGVILYFGKDLFVPLSLAVLISFIAYPICSWLEARRIGRLTAILICILILALLILAVLSLFTNQLFSFLKEWPLISQKLSTTLKQLSQFLVDTYGISSDQQSRWISQIANQSVSNFGSLLRAAILTSTFSAMLMILVPVYTVLILYYRRRWLSVLYSFFHEREREQITEVLSLSITAYYNFIKGMAVVYLIVGILNSAGLLLLGIPHAILFGFIASVLTFIPYVGIIIGSLLPITMAWITYDSIWYSVAVIAVFTFVQYLEANLIFPLAVSNRLHVNTLVVLVAIFLGGILWGVAGMILFVPFVAIGKLIADHNPKLKTLSLILGQEERKTSKEKAHENK